MRMTTPIDYACSFPSVEPKVLGAALKCPDIKVEENLWELLLKTPLEKYIVILMLPEIWRGLGLELAPTLLEYWLYETEPPSGSGYQVVPPMDERLTNIIIPIYEKKWARMIVPLHAVYRDPVRFHIDQSLRTSKQRLEAAIESKQVQNYIRQYAAEEWGKVSRKSSETVKEVKFGHPLEPEYPTVPLGREQIYLTSYLGKISNDPSGDVAFGLGDFSTQCYFAGTLAREVPTEIHLKINQLQWRIIDEYHFKGDQRLGYWSRCGLSLHPEPNNVALNNQTFQDLQDKGKKEINALIDKNRDRCRDARKLKCSDFLIFTEPTHMDVNLECKIPIPST